MEEQIEKGKFCSEEQLVQAGYKKNNHGIGLCEIWVLNNGYITWLFRHFSTKIIFDIVTNYN